MPLLTTDMERTIYEAVTDEMLTTPVQQLQPAQMALLHKAFSGPFGEDLIKRLDKLNAKAE